MKRKNEIPDFSKKRKGPQPPSTATADPTKLQPPAAASSAAGESGKAARHVDEIGTPRIVGHLAADQAPSGFLITGDTQYTPR